MDISYITLFLISLLSVAVAQQQVRLLSDSVDLQCGDVQSVAANDSLNWEFEDPTGVVTQQLPANITVTVNERGKYTCTKNNATAATYTVGVFSEPTFVNARTSVTYNEGDHNREITCESDSYPEPTFVWSRRGSMENELPIMVSSDTNANYEITTNGTRSVLKFINVTYDEQSTFICAASNFAGNGSVELLVRVKNRYAAVWPFIGIVIEVVLLIVIIFVYEKRSKKANKEKPTFSPSEDEKPLNRDEGVEMRNRHGNK